MSDQLSQSNVEKSLNTRWMGRNYYHFPAIGSTNDELALMIDQGDDQHPPEGTVLVADYQSRGRGRLDRQWLAPPQTSLLTSILFRPGWEGERGSWLTMVVTVAAAEAIEACTPLNVRLKWPNDLVLMIDSQWHKVSGLLLQGNLSPQGRLSSAVVGIGINVNIPGDHLPPAITPATSLLAAAGRPVSRLALLVDFLGRVEEKYMAIAQGVSPVAAWRSRLITLGEEVTVTRVGDTSSMTGVAEDTDALGHLLVRDASGVLRTVSAGDVTLRGP